MSGQPVVTVERPPDGYWFEPVVVVGAGLIGGSIARRLHGLKVDVRVVEPDPATRALVAEAGIAVVDAVPGDAAFVILACPLDVMPRVMAALPPGRPDRVVMDVGSVKEPVTEMARAAGLTGFVGAHPMAGTEQTGFEHSDADLLWRSKWAVTYSELCTSGALARAAYVVASWFEAVALVMDPDDHDAAVALVSHAPHTLAHALLDVVEHASEIVPEARHLAAGSFRDVTRVAGTNPARTFNMLSQNATNLTPVLDLLIDRLMDLRTGLADPDRLRARLEAVALGADDVRSPAVEWHPVEDLNVLVKNTAESLGSILVSFVDGQLMWGRP